MIIFDNETTDLVAPEAAPLEQQPYITEFAAIKVHPKTLEEQARLSFFIRPRVRISDESIAITGITNEMVASAPPFAARYEELCEFFGGQRIVVAHNVTFDIAVLYHELRRIGKVTAFPWPPKQICTVEKTVHFHGYRMKLGDLHAELIGAPHVDAHRAMPDVEALVRIVRKLRERKVI